MRGVRARRFCNTRANRSRQGYPEARCTTLRSLAGHDLESRASGQGRGIVVVFIALGNGEPALPHQGQEVVFDLAGITGIMKVPGGFVGETVAPVQFTEQQATGIRNYPAALKIGHNFLGEKGFSQMSCLWQTVFLGYPL